MFLQSKRGFAGVVQLRILRWEIHLDYLGGNHKNPKVNIRILKDARRRQKVKVREISEGGGRGPEPGTWAASRNWKTSRELILLKAFLKECSLDCSLVKPTSDF